MVRSTTALSKARRSNFMTTTFNSQRACTMVSRPSCGILANLRQRTKKRQTGYMYPTKTDMYPKRANWIHLSKTGKLDTYGKNERRNRCIQNGQTGYMYPERANWIHMENLLKIPTKTDMYFKKREYPHYVSGAPVKTFDHLANTQAR